MVTTASASATASSADPARWQPRSAALASAASERSKAMTSCPALARFAAIPPPMLPSPMNAIRAMVFLLQLLPSPLREEGRAAQARSALARLDGAGGARQSGAEPDRPSFRHFPFHAASRFSTNAA